MCAGSEAKIMDTNVSVYMGDYGGNIKIGNLEYDADKTKSSRNDIFNLLASFNKKELITLIIDLIDNSIEG